MPQRDKKQLLIPLQITVGLFLCIGVVWAWLDSGFPLWEVELEDGSYAIGWRSALVVFAVLLACQGVSYLIFRPLIRWSEGPQKA